MWRGRFSNLQPPTATIMDFHTYTTMRDWTRRVDPEDRPAQDIDLFHKRAILDAQKMGSGQFFGQMLNERDWEKRKRSCPGDVRQPMKGTIFSHACIRRQYA